MSAIGKGDWVQCIRDEGESFFGFAPSDFIRVDGVYCVQRVYSGENYPDGIGAVDLVGIEAMLPFCLSRFKPLGGNAKTLTLKAPPIYAPARVRAGA